MNRIDREKMIAETMIRLYCRHGEGNQALCDGCASLLAYVRVRLERCPFGLRKSSCRKCSVHCYNPDMAARIRSVMRYAGPRMIIYHPVYAVYHFLREITV